MAKISISMSDEMEKFVEERVGSGDYNNTSEYFRDLVRRDQEKRSVEDNLRGLIAEARASGISKRSFNEIWDSAEEKFRRKRSAK